MVFAVLLTREHNLDCVQAGSFKSTFWDQKGPGHYRTLITAETTNVFQIPVK